MLAACGAPSAGSAAPDPAPTRSANTSSFYEQEFAYENGAIRDLKASCDQQGTVVSLEYETPAYAVNDLLGLNEALRAFAGLSRGAMTVARSGLTSNTDIFAWFGSFSGAWQGFDSFKEAMEGKFKDYSIKFWFNGNGKNDFSLNNHRGFCEKALTKMSDKFIDGENYAFVTLNDGDHVYASWIVDLYNSLLVFFK